MSQEDRSYVYEREVGDESLHFSDDLGFGASLEGLKGYVEHRLLLHYLLYKCFSISKTSRVLSTHRWCLFLSSSHRRRRRRGHRNFLDVETRLTHHTTFE